MLSLGSFYPYLILSGIIWPLEGMPFGMRQFSYFLPQTLSVLSIRNIMLKGWSFFHTYVWLGFLSTIAWIVIFIIMATIISSLRNR
jgi:ABC-type multidrug transport system permease subunit